LAIVSQVSVHGQLTSLFWATVRENNMAEGHKEAKLFVSWWPGSRMIQTGKGQGKIYPLNTHLCQ
jgi:hypothetical protein